MTRGTWIAIAVCLVLAGLIALQAALRMQAVAGTADRIVLWHAYIDKESDALMELVAAYNADPALHQGVKIEVLSVAFGNFPDKLTNALPRGQGPDLFIFAHDRLEDWLNKGLLAPVDFWIQPEDIDDFSPALALSAFLRGNRLYGLPLTAKNLALYVRRLPDGTDVAARVLSLAQQKEWNYENFQKLARDLTRPCPWNPKLRCYGLGVQADDAYHHAMWLHAMGGSFLDAEGMPETKSPPHDQAAKLAHELAGAHPSAVVPAELSYPLMSDLFMRGEIAMVISGPWFQSQLDPSKVPYTVVDFPMVGERYPAPFLSLEGLYLSSRSTKPDAAMRAMKYLAGAHSAELRARKAGQPPVRGRVASAMKAECRNNPQCDFDRFFYAEFLQVAQKGVVMPATAEARVMWPPYTRALASIVRRNRDIRAALDEAAWEISRYVGACPGGAR